MTEESATTTPAPRPCCGPYELLVRIGKGGMASVYLALSDTGELVALKVLHPHLCQQPELVDMLMDEARIASQLHHENVVRTLEIGRDGERYYLVMEYVEGVALDRLLRRSEGARPELIVPLAIDALRGLSAAHRLTDELGRPLELVHRDVTPGNVIIGADGVARIADFGVAKARARITKTMPGIVKGKAGYVAPEVVLGRDIDGRADIFSMGVLLYNALTGETLFDDSDLASTLTKLLQQDPAAPSTVGYKPPPIFDAPILGALHREPELRHVDAIEMAEALEDALIVYGDRGREPIKAWVQEKFGPQLAQRRRLAGGTDEMVDPEGTEPISTSGMIRRDPTGSLVELPEHYLDSEGLELPMTRPWLGRALLFSAAAIALVAAGLIGAWIATAS